MSRDELRRVSISTVDVRGDDTVKVSPSDNHSHNQTSLINSLNIIADPGYRVGDAGINANRRQKGSGITDVNAVCRDKEGEPNNTNWRNSHITHSSLVGAVGDVTNQNCDQTSNGVDGDGEELGFRASVTHVTNDGWKEEGEGVEWHVATHIDHHAKPHLIIHKRLLDRSLGEGLVLVGGLLVGSKTADDADGTVTF